MKNNGLGLKSRTGIGQDAITVDFSQRIKSCPPESRASAPFDMAKAFFKVEFRKPSAKADCLSRFFGSNKANSNKLIHLRIKQFELNNKYSGPAAKS